MRAGKRKKAIEAFQTALRINPEASESRFFLAALYLANNDRASAIRQYAELKTQNAELAGKLYRAIFKDKLLVVEAR